MNALKVRVVRALFVAVLAFLVVVIVLAVIGVAAVAYWIAAVLCLAFGVVVTQGRRRPGEPGPVRPRTPGPRPHKSRGR